jgi:hypothetical protein
MGSTPRTILVAALGLCVLQAQQRQAPPPVPDHREEMLLESMNDAPEREREEKAKRRAALYEFLMKWNKAVEAMNVLRHSLEENKADLKKFKSAHKALRELEADPNWLGK